jgi:hypothetical protein
VPEAETASLTSAHREADNRPVLAAAVFRDALSERPWTITIGTGSIQRQESII